jgi:putative FmdB family regulatory protein
MPIYEYECRACGHNFEQLVRSSDTTPPACPACQGQDLEKILSMFAVSSETTRGIALKDGRRRSARTQRDKNQAQLEYEKNHAH